MVTTAAVVTSTAASGRVEVGWLDVVNVCRNVVDFSASGERPVVVTGCVDALCAVTLRGVDVWGVVSVCTDVTAAVGAVASSTVVGDTNQSNTHEKLYLSAYVSLLSH